MSELISTQTKKQLSLIEKYLRKNILSYLTKQDIALYQYVCTNLNDEYERISKNIVEKISIILNKPKSFEEIYLECQFDKQYSKEFIKEVLDSLKDKKILKIENNKYQNSKKNKTIIENFQNQINSFSKFFRISVIRNEIDEIKIVENNVTIIMKNQIKKDFKLNNQIVEELLTSLLNDIIYTTTNKKISIKKNENNELFTWDKIILPRKIIDRLLFDLPNILEKAMKNCITYLPEGQITLYTDNNIKYVLSTNSIHMLGLEKRLLENRELTETIKKHSFSIYERNSIPNYGLLRENYSKSKLSNLHQKLYELAKLDIEKGTINLVEQIKKLNECQKIIYEIMTNPNEEKNIIAWLYYEKYGPKILTEKYDAQKIESRITEIISENDYRFSNKINNLFKKDKKLTAEEEQIKQNIINGVSGRYGDKKTIESIIETFKYIEEVEHYLMYLKQKYSKAILSIPESDIEIFDKKLGITTIEELRDYFFKSKFKNNGGLNLGYISLAHIAIKEAILNYKNKPDYVHLINLFKVTNKLLYLCHFNFQIGIKKIYITDLQFHDNVDILCEIEGIDETLFGYFEKIDKKGITEFYSIQSSKDRFMIKSPISNTNILVALSRDKSNILTNAHTKVREENLDNKESAVQYFINALKNNEIVLRYAPSFEVQTSSDKKGLLFYRDDKVLDNTDKRVLSLEESKSVIEWITNLNQEEFENFSGLKVEDINQLNEIKLLLIHNLNQSIKDIVSKRIIEIDNSIKDLNTEIEKITQDIIIYSKNISLDLAQQHKDQKTTNEDLRRILRYRSIESDLSNERQKLMNKFGILFAENSFYHTSVNRVVEITKEILYDNYDINEFIKLLDEKNNNTDSYKNLILNFPLLTLSILANKTNNFNTLTSNQKEKIEILITDIIITDLHNKLEKLLEEYTRIKAKELKSNNIEELNDDTETAIIKGATYYIRVASEIEYLISFPIIYNLIKNETTRFMEKLKYIKDDTNAKIKKQLSDETIRKAEEKSTELKEKLNDSFSTGTFTSIGHHW